MKSLTYQNILEDLDNQGLKRHLRLVSSAQGSTVRIDGKELLNFCSNNYLGLANDERLKKAAINSITEEGVGSGASRLVCGNLSAHNRLEKKIADFKGTEKCIVYSTGYMANVGIISSVFDKDDIIFADKLIHASLIDGILLSQAKFKRYAHVDMNALDAMLQSAQGYKKKVIITDTVFSMDGDIAPLDKIVELAEKYDCLVMVDEAHALGVLGEKGKGAVEHFGLEGKIDIQMGTLSKAAGSFGGYCCGSADLIDFLINKARSFVYTTGMPPSVAAASLKGIEIIENDLHLRELLWSNTRTVQERLKEAGFDTLKTQTPIIPLLIGDSKVATEFSQRLYDQGILVSAIRPPTVPQNTARLRITIMANHRKEDLDFLCEKCIEIGESLCIL